MKKGLFLALFALLIAIVSAQPHSVIIGFVDSEGNTIAEEDLHWEAERVNEFPGDVLNEITSFSTAFYPSITGPSGDMSMLQIQCADFTNPWAPGQVVSIYIEKLSTGDGTYLDITLTSAGVDLWDPTYTPIFLGSVPGPWPLPVAPIYPQNNTTEIALPVQFEWGNCITNEGYKISIGTDNPPTNIVDMLDLGLSFQYNCNQLTNDETYYWQITPYNSLFGDAWDCPVWSFTTSQSAHGPLVYNDTIDFSVVDVNTTSNQSQIVFYNPGAETVTINNPLELSGNDSDLFNMYDNNIYPTAIPAMDSISLFVDFTPTSPGHKYAEIEFTEEGHSAVEVITIEGYGYEPDGNDSSDTATFLDTQLWGTRGVIVPDNDIDWYVCWAPYTATFSVEVINDLNSQMDFLVTAFGPYTVNNAIIDENVPTLIDYLAEPWEIEASIYADGYYYIKVENLNRDRQTQVEICDYQLWLDVDPFLPSILPPQYLNCEIIYNGIELSWEEDINSEDVLYNVYRDDVQINTEPVNENYYFDPEENLIQEQLYEYKVTAFITEPAFLESEPCDSVIVTFVDIAEPPIHEDFEDYDDFSTTFGDWVTIDGDGENTMSFGGLGSFPDENSPMSFIIFNPDSTTPPLQNADAYSGNKYAAALSSVSSGNDNWLITRPIHLGTNTGYGDEPYISYIIRPYSNQLGLEQIEFCISNGSINPDDFTVISGNEPLGVPEAWTQYSFDLSAYCDQIIRVAIHHVSPQGMMLMVDDIMMIGTVDNEDNEQPVIESAITLHNNYPNPFNPETTISFNMAQNAHVKLDIYNVKGQLIETLVNDEMKQGNHCIIWDAKEYPSGIYFYKLQSETYTKTKKMVLMK